MRSAIDLPRVPWRGVTAFALDNLLPVLGFAAVVVGAFHLPGVWGQVVGWIAGGAALVYTRHLASEEIEALKQRARSEAIDRHQERARARLARQAHLASVPKAA